jgi:DNA primase
MRAVLPRIQPLHNYGYFALALIPEEKIAEIRDRTDIVQVIGEYVSLKRSGVNHKGLCPFHAEKSPSFNVNAQKQIYHCFGCGKSGDVYRFLMEHDGKNFLDVVRELGKRAGVDLPEREQSPEAKAARARAEGDRARMLRVTQLACDYFRGELNSARGERGRSYIERRGIGARVREEFLLGYAPPGWDGLVKFLEAKRVPAELAERAGLIRARDHAKRAPETPPTKATHFDLFRDRVIFPLVSPQGEVIAFGGRTLETDEKVPKYINSPETILYKKGDNLYGLHAAKGAIRKSGRAILVEGNFDVLAMHEKGFGETVAPMGTALTPAQVHLLHRYSPAKVYMFLDGDKAGYAAAARNVATFLDEDLVSCVAKLPRGEDPDTFVGQNGADAVQELLSGARESVEYFTDFVWTNESGRLSPIEAAQILENEAAPLIRKVKIEAARLKYGQKLALGLGLAADAVNRMIRVGKAAAPSPAPAPIPSAAPPAGTGTETAEKAGEPAPPVVKLTPGDLELVALVADHPVLLGRLVPMGAIRCIAHPQMRRAFATMAGEEKPKFEAQKLAESVDEGQRGDVMKAAMSGRYAEIPDPERALAGIMKKFETANVIAELKRALAEARAAGDSEQIQKLNARINELNQKRLGLKG